MQISTRFSIAVHTLLCIAAFADEHKVTSDFIAGSVGVHPVTIRKTLGALKKAGLADVAAGTGGASLARDMAEISLLDVYRAVDLLDDNALFAFHESPNPACPVGQAVRPLLESCMREAQEALEAYLRSVTLQRLRERISLPLARPCVEASKPQTEPE